MTILKLTLLLTRLVSIAAFTAWSTSFASPTPTLPTTVPSYGLSTSAQFPVSTR